MAAKVEPIVPRAIDIEEILELIPHRYPLLLVDRVLEVVPHKAIVAIKNVTINEPYFAGHFPGRPVVPGVIVLETILQAATVLGFVSEPERDRDQVYLLGMDKVKFRRRIVPGDVMRAEIKVKRIRGLIWSFAARLTVDGELAVSGEFVASFAG